MNTTIASEQKARDIRATSAIVKHDPKILFGLDTPDCVTLDNGSDLYIHGWLFTSDADIEAIYISCNGAKYAATYPVRRPELDRSRGEWIDSTKAFPRAPHARDLNPDIDPPYSFGFASAPISLNSGTGQHVELCLIAIANGSEHVLLVRRIELVWSDPEKDLFKLGMIASFQYPSNFDQSRLSAYPDYSPTFLIGRESAVSRCLCMLNNHGLSIPDATIFMQMRDAIVACYDVYCEFDWLYFKPLDSQYNNVASCKFKIYELLNAVVASFHDLLPKSNDTESVYALTDENDVDLVPLLKAIYPHSVFVRVSEMPPGEANHEGNDAHERGFAKKIHILENGNATIRFQDVQLDEQGNEAVDLRTVEQLLNLLGLSENAHGEKVDTVNAIQASAEKQSNALDQNYLQALPSYDEQRPIFVLGAGRSGTSAMAGALKAAGILGFYEGHVFPLINEMARRVWELSSLRPEQGRSRSDLRAHTVHLIAKTCFEQVYGEFGNQVWLDKTADHLMIYCVPLLRKMFPQARFLFLRKHPIAVAESRSRKFGETPFFSILEWNKCIRGWSDHKYLVDESNYLECDAKDLRDRQLHSRLSAFLGLDQQSSRNFSDFLATKTPEMTRIPALKELEAYYRELDERQKLDFDVLLFSLLDALDVYIEDTNWDADTVAWVENSLGGLPKQFGYAIHRPENMMISLLVTFAKQIDQYRQLAECRQINAPHWKERHNTQMTNPRECDQECVRDNMSKAVDFATIKQQPLVGFINMVARLFKYGER